MLDALKGAGVSNYSIFRHGLTLFGYFETDDIEKIQKYLAESETNRRRFPPHPAHALHACGAVYHPVQRHHLAAG